MTMIASRIISLVGISLLSLAAFAQDNEMTFARPDIEPLKTALVMELKVLIGQPVSIGETDKGVRRFIPITGGEFEGEGIKGDVIPGGADWQLVRPDGVTEVKAIYAIRTDDGAVINVDNRGLVHVEDGSGYVRTVPTFQAPKGKYDWLNKRIFAGTITPSVREGFVTIRVFKVL